MKRLLVILISIPLLVVGVMAVGFGVSQVNLAAKEFPAAEQSPDWSILGLEEIPSIVTLDEDGELRITQVWIASLEGRGYLRTGDTRWFGNLQRDPTLELRIGGEMYRCATRVVTDQSRSSAVHQAFYDKYPKRSKMFRAIGVATNAVIALDCGETRLGQV